MEDRSKKRTHVDDVSGTVKLERVKEMTTEEVRIVHGVGRFAGFDAEPHLLERMEHFVGKQASFEIDYTYFISNSQSPMFMRLRRRVLCEHITQAICEDFVLKNAEECVDAAIWITDAYISKKKPEEFIEKDFIDLVLTAICMATKVHNLSYICFDEIMKHTENSMTKKDMKTLEADILMTLDWKLLPTTVPAAIELIAALVGCPAACENAGKARWYKCRWCLDTMRFTPAVLAAAALSGYSRKNTDFVFDEQEAAHLCHSTVQAVRLADDLLVEVEAKQDTRVDAMREKKQEAHDANTEHNKKQKAEVVA